MSNYYVPKLYTPTSGDFSLADVMENAEEFKKTAINLILAETWRTNEYH